MLRESASKALPHRVLRALIAVGMFLTGCDMAVATQFSGLHAVASASGFMLGVSFLSALWIVRDVRVRRAIPVMDAGYFLLSTFPLGSLYYLFSSRGFFGAILLLVPLASLLLAGSLFGALLAFLVR